MNIRQIAERANVSIATVSRILNGSPKVSHETRRRVMEIIQESNWVPSAMARSMNHGKTSILGLILPDITNPFFPDIARGVEDTANALGYKVILCNTDNERETEETYLRTLREQRVDGLILVSSSNLEEQQVREIFTDAPIVWCDRAPERGTSSSVLTNHYEGAKLAVEHLIGLGHREIAMISGPPIPASLERQRAFQDIMKHSGIHVFENRIVSGRYQYESGYEGMKQILSNDEVTAVFCANDMMAFGAINFIRDKGLRVPEDISVVGYDNILFSAWSQPALTTVSQPTYQLGMNAVELLVDAIREKEQKPVRRLLEPRLVVRNSTSKVKL